MNLQHFHAAMEMAAAAVQRGSYHAALQHYADALTENPESAEAHARLSICLSRMNRRFSAVEEAERALRVDPEYPLGHIALGYAALFTGDVRGARAAVERVRKLEPDGDSAFYLRCDVALAMRNGKELRAAAMALLAQSPEDTFGVCMLSRAAAMEGRGAEAERLAREALRAEPEDSLAHECIGWAFFAQRLFAQAKEAGQSALSLSPDNPSAFLLMAASTLRQRWLTGWFFWFALWATQNSERSFMTAVIIYSGVTMVLGNFLWFYNQTLAFDILNYGAWVVSFAIIVSYLILTRILQNEARNVRLVSDY